MDACRDACRDACKDACKDAWLHAAQVAVHFLGETSQVDTVHNNPLVFLSQSSRAPDPVTAVSPAVAAVAVVRVLEMVAVAVVTAAVVEKMTKKEVRTPHLLPLVI